MSQYTVLTGDVIKSRDYDNVREILNNSFKKVKYPKNVITPFQISRGDEIQAVFKNYIPFPKLIRQIRYELLPLEIRFGIGFGEINEDINQDNSWNMNGTAFYNARKALKIVDENRTFYTQFVSNSKIDEAINTILYLIDTLEKEWTDAQWEAIYYYEKKGTYKKAAKELDIAFQNVEKRCRAAKWKEVNFAENSIEKILKNFC